MSRVQGNERATITSKARARKRHRRNVTIATVLTAVLCVGGGGIAFAATRPSTVDYRTTTAATGDVTETVNLTGTVASAKSRDAAFATAGTVGSVAVKLGQKVTAGQTLATLKSASLTAAVTTAEQAVVQATQQLADDITAQSSTSTTSTGSSTGGTTSGSTSTGGSSTSSGGSSTPSTGSGSGSAGGSGSGSGGSGSGSGSGNSGSSANTAAVKKAVAAVTAAQDALLKGYATAQTSVEATNTLVAASTPTCAPFLAATISDSDAASTTDPSATLTPAQQVTAAQAALAGCKTAVSDALDSEQATDDAQKQVQVLATDLNKAVAALTSALSAATAASASTSSAVTSAPTVRLVASITGTGTGTTGGTGGGTGSAGGSSATITAATLLSDEAAITAAKAELAIAKNSKTLGTLTSPIAGTVASVSITKGSSVSAGSTTDVITIIGDDGYVVTSTATLTAVQKLAVADAVAITVPSSTKALAGTISSIGVTNVSTSTTPSYDVTIAVTDKTASLLNGASATMVVTADTAQSVLTVPTSAVHRAAQTYTVDVLKDGKLVSTKVKIGAVGAESTQITSGISKGTEVILANVASTTIGDSTSTTTSTTGGLAGLGGSTTTGGAGGTGGPPAGFTRGG